MEPPHVEGAEQDKKVPTYATAAAALRGDDHQPSSAPALRAAANTAMVREAAAHVAVEGQRRVIVFVREARPKRHSRTVIPAPAPASAKPYSRSGLVPVGALVRNKSC